MHSAPRSAPALIALLRRRDTEEELRADAAEALAHIHEKSVVPAIVKALGDQSALVRFSAAYAAGEQGDVRARDVLKHLSTSDHAETPWGVVSAQAERSLAAIRDDAS